ncbi:hypothetical protein diail_9212 [Diaporthe ilicicola]|nr:hypothetical protein diail_9212 [Diaporthe ilicicola]
MAIFAIATLLCHAIFAAHGLAAAAQQPNIVFILTDDQDAHMQSVQHMPLLQQYLGSEGTTFTRHFCSVTDVDPPYGGYPKVLQVGINNWYLPIWLQEAGYNTYYTGKLWNQHTIENYNKTPVQGFNGSDFLLDPYTYQYFNAGMTRNGEPYVTYPGQYSPDVIAEKAYGFLDEATNHSEPFFLVAAPVASHSDVSFNDAGDAEIRMPQYPDRYKDLFLNYTIPRDANFNPAKQGGADWIAELPLLNDTVIAYNDEYQRARLRSLQAVDEMVEGLVTRLESKGLLNNTYIFYTTDNGFHISQHRMLPGKSCGYDTDINIPLIIRGPGVDKNVTKYTISNHQDFSPTIMSLAGQESDNFDFDGVPIPLYDGFTQAQKQENVDVEHWGRMPDEGIYKYPPNIESTVNTFKSVRVIGDTYSVYYSVWCTNEKEFYNMEADPWQLINLLSNSTAANATAGFSIAGRPFSAILERVDALLMVLKACKGIYCTQPWLQLHPSGNVKTLADALNEEYDSFYESQPKVSFSVCDRGYIVSAEGPQDVISYSDNATSAVASL